MAPEIDRVELEGVLVQDLGDSGPGRVDVARHAPGIGRGVAPGVDGCVAPFAEAVEDGAVLG